MLAVQRPRKSFLLLVPETGRCNEVEFQLEGTATLAELASTALAAAKAILGASNRRLDLQGLPASDPFLTLDDLKIKAPHQLSVVYTRDEGPELSPRSLVVRSGASALSLRDIDEQAVAWSDQEEIDRRIQKRVRAYSGYVQLSPPDLSKKVLVLDIDFTLLDTDCYNSHVGAPHVLRQAPERWLRPGMLELLSAAREHYNVVYWSATGMGHIYRKLRLAGVLPPQSQEGETPALAAEGSSSGGGGCPYWLLVDFAAMLRLRVRTIDGLGRDFNAKPLSVLHGLFPTVVTPHNTLIVDDHRRSFVLDSERGIHVTPYHATAEMRANDREFALLQRYLLAIKVRTCDCWLSRPVHAS